MSLRNISFGLAALVFAALPHASEAYFTTNQAAIKLNQTTALFAIEYSFGLEKSDIYMPVLAVRNLTEENSRSTVGYSVREESETVTTEGTAAGIVLSKAPIVDGMYKLEKGESHKMTLVVLYTTSSDAHEEDYALQMDWLPYNVDHNSGSLQELQLNPSELQYYVTKEVELNTGNFD